VITLWNRTMALVLAVLLLPPATGGTSICRGETLVDVNSNNDDGLARTSQPAATEFGAYYTKVDSGEEFERYSRTGEHADIVVRGVGNGIGRFVFHRSSSYIPYWKTAKGKWYVEELTDREGDGTEKMPDRTNTYSVARIIESSPEKVVIHWRYLPNFEGVNPHFNPTNLKLIMARDKIAELPKHLVDTVHFVDEYFTITPDGTVTRTFKPGTEKHDDWADPRNIIVQKLNLSADGIKAKIVHKPVKTEPAKPIQGNRVVANAVVAPIKWWRFDEGAGDVTKEAVAGDLCKIEGHKSYWKEGVSGAALAFDGYETVIRLPAVEAPSIVDDVTLEGWVALGAYPWNWTPVVQQGHEKSYYLGVGPHGHIGLTLKIGDSVVSLQSKKQLERKRWYHLVGTYDSTSGTMRIFIDGEVCGERITRKDGIGKSNSPIQIGKGKKMSQSDPVRASTFEDSFSFDGLIDEVRIYDVAMTSEQVLATYKVFQLSDNVRNHPDLDSRILPSGRKTGRFGAHYTHFKFYDTWDGMFRFGGHPDVAVEFDKHPTSFVFWRGTGFIPMLVNEKGEWYSNEFNETWGRSGGRGCQEPMSDKEAFSNHVKILENTPARAVVLWRYPLVDVLHVIANFNEKTGWGDWSDWVYTIYPDGVAVKRMRLWTSGPINHEWQESMVITGPDQHPEQVVETDPALILATLDGTKRGYSWKSGPPRNVDYSDVKIHVVNYKGDYDPFTIGDIQGGDVYGGEVTNYSVLPSWNHWPVAQMPSDGRYAKFPDRTAHSSLTHINPAVYKRQGGDRAYQERLLMEGMTKKKPKELVRLARSWLQAPGVKALAGCNALAYDKSKREYPLAAEKEKMSVSIDASEKHPLVNVCFTVKNWGHDGKACVLVNGKTPTEVRQGTFVDTDGTTTMVIWIEVESTSPTEFTIDGAKPPQ